MSTSPDPTDELRRLARDEPDAFRSIIEKADGSVEARLRSLYNEENEPD